MEMNQPPKPRIRSLLLNGRKPVFWILLSAILTAAVAAVSLLTLPKLRSAPDSVIIPAGKASVWLDDSVDETPDSVSEITIDAFPNIVFRGTFGSVEAVEALKTRTLFTGMPIRNVFFADVTGDGKPELCAAVYFGSGIVDSHIVVYDYANKQSYTLWARGTFDYHLYTEDGTLYIGKAPYMDDKQLDTGMLVMRDGELCCQWKSDGSFVPLSRELHESELFGEWLVEEETDNDGNVLYAFGLDLWKEYDFKEDGTVVYNETVPISSDSELAFGHPVSCPFAVHNDHLYIDEDAADGTFRWGEYDRETDSIRLIYNSPDGGSVYATLRRMGADFASDA